jgi:hypothetical protein
MGPQNVSNFLPFRQSDYIFAVVLRGDRPCCGAPRVLASRWRWRSAALLDRRASRASASAGSAAFGVGVLIGSARRSVHAGVCSCSCRRPACRCRSCRQGARSCVHDRARESHCAERRRTAGSPCSRGMATGESGTQTAALCHSSRESSRRTKILERSSLRRLSAHRRRSGGGEGEAAHRGRARGAFALVAARPRCATASSSGKPSPLTPPTPPALAAGRAGPPRFA